MEPEISVVIPVYNSEMTIEQAVYSVQAQIDAPTLEIICVDDGSTDGSRMALQKLSSKDPRIRVLSQKNQFAGTARNRGMDLARGKYIAFLDADDEYLPGALRALYEKTERYSLDLIKGSFRYVDDRTGDVFSSSYARNRVVEWPWRGKVLCFEKLPRRLAGVSDVPWNGLYRREFLECNGIRFNHLRCVNDHSFYIACLLHAERMMVVDTEVACYHIEQDTSLIGKKARYFSCQFDSYQIVKKLCQGLPLKFRQIILEREFTGVFSWYERLSKPKETSAVMEAEMKQFLMSYDENDVGTHFLWSFPYSQLYYRLRYDSLPPRGRPSLLLRAFRCWQENGWHYTMERIIRKGSRK